MLPCINKACKNKSYVPRRMVEKNKLKDIICHPCAMKAQKDYFKLSKREREKIEAETDKIFVG